MCAKLKNNFTVRALSSVAVVVVVVGAALAGRWAFAALCAVVTAGSAFEFGRLATRMKMPLWTSVPLAVAYTVLPPVLLMYLYIYVGVWPVLWYIFVIWGNDVGAYAVGVTLGRHKFCPRISPLKTWEGFYGGVVTGVAVGIAGALTMGWNVGFWTLLSVVAVLSGVVGDLVESQLKRMAGVKDSGRLLPGHGGMLDRFDALIFSVPFVFACFMIFR
jgi:CDP-diglyceride synthetase